MVLETEGIVDVVEDEEDIGAETGESVVVPKGLPSPSLPSQAEVEHYNLTHLRCGQDNGQRSKGHTVPGTLWDVHREQDHTCKI